MFWVGFTPIHPSNSECYYLCLLLHEVRGSTTFSDLKKVEGVVNPTFQSACRALGLLEDDNHWHKTLEETALSRSPIKIRELFSVMLVFCQVSNAFNLWETYKESMADDVKRNLETEYQKGVQVGMEIVFKKTVMLIEDLVFVKSGHGLKQYGLPTPSLDHDNDSPNCELKREVAYNVVQLSEMVNTNEPKLNFEQ